MAGYRRDSIYQALRWLRRRPAGTGSFAELWAKRAGLPPDGVRTRFDLVNYKPFERAWAVAEVILPRSRTSLWLHLHIGAGPVHEKRAPVVLDEHGISAWTIPDAPGLPGLRELLEPERFRALVATVPELRVAGPVPPPELVRYVPAKRALLRWTHPATGRRYWLKQIAGTGTAAAASLDLRELRAWYEHGAFSARVPRLVHYGIEHGVLVMDEVPGMPLTDLMTGRRTEPLIEVGEALARLHATPTVPWREWSFAHEHRQLARHMHGVAQALPALAARIDLLVDHLGASMPQGRAGFAPIHGNLFGDQILYDPTAEHPHRVGIVDWDSWCHGDPHYDLGRLLAHLAFLRRLRGHSRELVQDASHALIEGYRHVAGPEAIDPHRLAWQTATALLLRAKISSVRKLAPGWTRHVALTLDEAEGYARCWIPAVPARPTPAPERRLTP